MKLFARFIFCAMLLSSSLLSFSQLKKANTLLWKITGNGLSEPSYLFGTIHLTNKELFQFGDSVYKAIEQSKGFAIEVNPDEMATYYINKMFDDLTNDKKVSSMMNKEKFDRYKKRLSKKFSKPAEEVTAQDILKEKNKWISEYMEKGEMPTFMDAYLYNIARKQGKWLGGIEDISDQASLGDELVDVSDIDYLLADQTNGGEGRTMLENMMHSYINEDLDAIEKMASEGFAEKKDLILIKRNVKMASRMDSLSALRSMFFAVGAAHLPGDSGVIDLLLKKGFKVEPVFSKGRMDARSYKYKEIDQPWINIQDKQQLYSASMPGKPTDVRPLGLTNMKFFMDLFNLSGYYTMAVVNPRPVSNYDSLFLAMAEGMFKGKKVGKAKVIDKGKILGREYINEVEKGMMRIQVFMHERIIYVAGLYVMKKMNVQGKEAERFFQSFRINPSAMAKLEAKQVFIDSVMGIKLTSSTPWEFNSNYSKQDTSETWKVTTYTSVDVQNGGYNFLMSKEPKPGQYILNDSAMYADLFSNMKETYSNIQRKDTLLQGLPSSIIYGDNIDENNLSLRIWTTIRGNRNIVLMSIGEKDYLETGAGSDLFKSFELIPQKDIPWMVNLDPAKSFSTWSPGPFFFPDSETNKTPGRAHLASYDTLSSTTYAVVIDTLDKYFWRSQATEFWKEKKDQYVVSRDSLVEEKDVTNGMAKGKEFVVRIGQTGTYERSRILLHGNIVYALYVSASKDELNSTKSNKFFTDFDPKTRPADFKMTASKTSLILKDIRSKDSATRDAAVNALEEAKIDEKDLKLLHEAFFRKYDRTEPWSSVTEVNKLIGEKISLIKSPKSVQFLHQHYPRFKDSVSMQLMLIDILAEMKTLEAFNAVSAILESAPPAESLNYSARESFIDTLKLSVNYANRFSKLASSRYHAPFIANLYLQLLDSGLIKKEAVLGIEKNFIDAANRALPALSHKDSSFDYNTYSLVTILARMNTQASIEMLKRLQTVYYPYLKKRVVIELLKAGKEADTTSMIDIASNPAIRMAFYDDLKELKKESQFPGEFLTQKLFAEAHMYSAAEDDEEPTSVELIGTRKATVEGKEYYFYLYKVSYYAEEDEVSYLGVAGGFNADDESVEVDNDLCGVYYSEAFDPENIDKLFIAFVEE